MGDRDMELNSKDFGYTNIKEPEFVKDFNFEQSVHSNELLSLMDYASKDSRAKIEKELLIIKNSFFSEKNVYNEIKKSRLPLVCLHDIRLEHRGLDIEFDFIVIASEFILMIETKPFFGDVTINFKKEITRAYPYKDQTIKESISSQIVKTDRNIKFLERFLRDNRLVKDVPIYQIAVIGSDETRLKSRFAKASVKKQFIHYTELIKKMNEYIKKNQTSKIGHNQMREIADVIYKEHKPVVVDYEKKLNLSIITSDSKNIKQKKDQVKDTVEDPSEALLYKTVKDAKKDLFKNTKSPFYRGYKKQ
jgi:hypothetical protein